MLFRSIRRKPVPPKYEGYVHAAGLMLLLMLMVYVLSLIHISAPAARSSRPTPQRFCVRQRSARMLSCWQRDVYKRQPLGTATVGKLVLQLAIPAMLAQFVNILYLSLIHI